MTAPRGPRDFDEAVLELVAQIPPGRAMAYGSVAACLGSRAARRVGWVMRTAGDEALPWWRVVSAEGLLPPPLWAGAHEHYLREGTPLRRAGDRTAVDLRRAAWSPTARPPRSPFPA